MKQRPLPISLRIEKDGNQFHSWCPELPGCETHGKTANETLENLKYALHLQLDTLMEEEIERLVSQIYNSDRKEAVELN